MFVKFNNSNSNGSLHSNETKTKREWLSQETLFWPLLSMFTVISLITHFHSLDTGHQVVWDEVHFGKMATWYLNRTYFFDVHPPLGKLLIAGLGYSVGYNGTFDWNVGQNFSGHHGILEMRFGFSFLGSLLTPLAFITSWGLTSSLSAACISSSLVVFDTGLTALTRYILLDQPLLLMIATSFLCWIRFEQVTHQFSRSWYTRLAWTGVSLGLVISIKHVGLFITIFVGLQTISQLWNIFSDLETDLKMFLKHVLVRVVLLITLPLTIYISIFLLHFTILTKSGPGDAYHSPLFQSYLEGNHYHNSSINLVVRDGAVISLGPVSGHPSKLLHSHWDLLPLGAGARHQIVGTFVHQDDNNKWVIRKWRNSSEHSDDKLIRHGDLVVLTHWITRRNLHSHNIPSINDKQTLQVTGFGDDGVGDENDVWRIEISGAGDDNTRVLTPLTPVIFKHHHLNCVLTDLQLFLPKEWSYLLSEVACSFWIRNTKHNLGFYVSKRFHIF